MKKLQLILLTSVLLTNHADAQQPNKQLTPATASSTLKSGHTVKNARYVFFFYIYNGVAEGSNGKQGALYIGNVVDLNSFDCTLATDFYCHNCNVPPANTWDKKYQCGLAWYQNKLKSFNIDAYFTSDWIKVVTSANVYENDHLVGFSVNAGDQLSTDKGVMERIRRKFIFDFGKVVVPVQ